jgi:hypothetical protein
MDIVHTRTPQIITLNPKNLLIPFYLKKEETKSEVLE